LKGERKQSRKDPPNQKTKYSRLRKDELKKKGSKTPTK